MSLKQQFVIICSVLGFFFLISVMYSHFLLSYSLRNIYTSQAAQKTIQIEQQLDLVHTLYMKMIKSSMRFLSVRAYAYGNPVAKGVRSVRGKHVPGLFFGDYRVANSDLVDEVSRISGGTATVFSRKGEDFYRLSTTIRRAGGRRAIGTTLNRDGKAYESLLRGKPYYGFGSILGKPYLSAYEPIFSKGQDVVGVLYVGYPVIEIKKISDLVTDRLILDNGFMTISDQEGKILFHSEGVDPKSIQAFDNNSEYISIKKSFKPWGYTVTSFVLKSDIDARVKLIMVRMIGPVALLLVSFFLLALYALSVALDRSREKVL